MTDTPWLGDACSLVDAFRSGERKPIDELEAVLGAIEASELNAFAFLDADGARDRGPRRRRVAAVRRRPARGQGARAGRGLAGHRGQPGVRRPRGGPHRHHDPPRRGCGRGEGRPDDGQRVRRPQRQRDPAARRHAQPLAARPHRRRLVGRVRRRGGRRAAADRLGGRRGRVDPHPGRVLRARRHEGHRRAHPARPPHRDRPAHRGHRVPGPVGARRGPLVRRVLGLRQPRPLQPAPHRRLGARPRHPRPGGEDRGHRPHARQRRGPPRGRGDGAGRRRGPGPRRGPATGRRAGAAAGARLRVGDGQPGAAPPGARRPVARLQGRHDDRDGVRHGHGRPGLQPRAGGALRAAAHRRQRARWPRCSTRSTS